MSAGKGSTPRKVDPKKWSKNYDLIFRKKTPKKFDVSTKPLSSKK